MNEELIKKIKLIEECAEIEPETPYLKSASETAKQCLVVIRELEREVVIQKAKQEFCVLENKNLQRVMGKKDAVIHHLKKDSQLCWKTIRELQAKLEKK